MSTDVMIDLSVEIHYETDNAWLVSTDGNRDNAKWVPKSKCSIENSTTGNVLLIPEWLADKKEFFK